MKFKQLFTKVLGVVKWHIKYFLIIAEAISYRSNYFVLVGTPKHGNLGDQAIALAEYELLHEIDPSRKILEIPGNMLRTLYHTRAFKPIIGNKKVLIHGGGFLGTLWMDEEIMVRNVILTYPNNQLIVFPQTIFFDESNEGKTTAEESKNIYDRHSNLWICMREEQSYELALKMFEKVHVILIPDMVPLLRYDEKVMDRTDILFCLRSDKERVLSHQDWNVLREKLINYANDCNFKFTDTTVNYRIKKHQRKYEVGRKLDEFSRSKLIITDRLHGMVFAAITGVPCIALGNCNYKVKGVYNWIKNNQYIVYVDNIDEIDKHIDHLIHQKNNVYDNDSVRKRYEQLKELIRE